ncbi:MAG TPA: PHP domain-containing protein [Thermoplasmatales archaeon]|nr:PHP domain-containing protein [Thermoplasmatales archaeon]
MFDLHVHTAYSRDGHASPEALARRLRDRGFAGMAITDHNTTEGAFRHIRLDDFLVIPGIEISTERGHLLGLGIQEPVTSRAAVEAVEEIHHAGGIAVVPHPGRTLSGTMKHFDDLAIDAIEACNGRSFPAQNRRAAALAGRREKGVTGGSDGHFAWEVGSAYTVAEPRPETVDDLLEVIRKKQTTCASLPSLLRPLRASAAALARYVSDGFARV